MHDNATKVAREPVVHYAASPCHDARVDGDMVALGREWVSCPSCLADMTTPPPVTFPQIQRPPRPLERAFAGSGMTVRVYRDGSASVTPPGWLK